MRSEMLFTAEVPDPLPDPKQPIPTPPDPLPEPPPSNPLPPDPIPPPDPSPMPVPPGSTPLPIPPIIISRAASFGVISLATRGSA
ncbi:MAG: hypothetical protein M3430_10795 [Acidobacteriota bacterium]|nr:hypothetical protein [Acidobacteriota bacterium]